MERRKAIKKISIKKLVSKDTVMVIESIVPLKDTLFPEELKSANEFLKQIDLSDFLNSSNK